jgi:hypothetical protein
MATGENRLTDFVKRVRPLLVGVAEGTCRVIPLATGWRITAGTTSRTLQHSTAFQLDTGGNSRGTAAIDLQYTRSNANEVAAGDRGGIYGGEDNRITDSDGFSSEYTTIHGSTNYLDDAFDCHVIGNGNTIVNDGYQVNIIGESIDDDGSTYIFASGLSHTTDTAYGCFVFGESNDVKQGAASDRPEYSGTFGLFSHLEGDVWNCFSFGYEVDFWGDGTPGERAIYSAIFGFENFVGNVQTNYIFGQGVRSYQSSYDGHLNGRIAFSGDYPNHWPAGSTPPAGTGGSTSSGYNQDSWFSQNDLITDWASAWTTARFEFPIISDQIWYFIAYIAGIEQGAANSYAWKIEGVVENDGGTTSILTSTVTNVYRDVATKEWQVIADDTNDRLVFQYRDTAGADATDCNIQFSMFTSEVGFD